jgi:hypothetical protein
LLKRCGHEETVMMGTMLPVLPGFRCECNLAIWKWMNEGRNGHWLCLF